MHFKVTTGSAELHCSDGILRAVDKIDKKVTFLRNSAFFVQFCWSFFLLLTPHIYREISNAG
ncbi:MAG: hypothetical protein D3915_01730 [Candidatus Electrothrix sp. AU1_5]|nr:hypothetical protein [Candidatus Electrothrix gigas]